MNNESNADSAHPLDPETAAIFHRLRQLLADLVNRADNRHDQAITLIAACIDEGIDEGKRIVGALTKLGFKPRHAGKMLNDGTGNDPNRYLWRRDEAGKYSVHPKAFQGGVAASDIKFEDSSVVG